MQVTTSFFGPIKKPRVQGPVQLPEGALVADLLAVLGYPKHHWNGILVLRNQRRLSVSDNLQDGDAVELTIRVGGG